ncbi:MAG: hypothetical protein R3B60_03245 [Candidatus Paceibacterota bacterium]
MVPPVTYYLYDPLSTSGEWYIDSQGTTTISYLDVQDSNNINVTTISCLTGCIDSGGNVN